MRRRGFAVAALLVAVMAAPGRAAPPPREVGIIALDPPPRPPNPFDVALRTLSPAGAALLGQWAADAVGSGVTAMQRTQELQAEIRGAYAVRPIDLDRVAGAMEKLDDAAVIDARTRTARMMKLLRSLSETDRQALLAAFFPAPPVESPR